MTDFNSYDNLNNRQPNVSVKRNRGVEQSVARRAHNPKVASSSLASATNADVAQSAERILGKDKVTGSIPVISSIGRHSSVG